MEKIIFKCLYSDETTALIEGTLYQIKGRLMVYHESEISGVFKITDFSTGLGIIDSMFRNVTESGLVAYAHTLLTLKFPDQKALDDFFNKKKVINVYHTDIKEFLSGTTPTFRRALKEYLIRQDLQA